MRAASAGAHRLASTTQSQVGSGRRSLADAKSSARKLESGVAFFGMAWPACCSSDRLEPGHFVDVDEWTGSVRGALLRPPRCFQAQGHSPQRSGRRACCRSANGKWGASRPCRTTAKCTAPPADCVRAKVGVARLDGDARVLTRSGFAISPHTSWLVVARSAGAGWAHGMGMARPALAVAGAL
jgi:hypothetical protein